MSQEIGKWLKKSWFQEAADDVKVSGSMHEGFRFSILSWFQEAADADVGGGQMPSFPQYMFSPR